jgi:hypothetical protein
VMYSFSLVALRKESQLQMPWKSQYPR